MRFIVRFGTRSEDGGRSTTWRLWSSKNHPDLYLAQRSQAGTIKASVHYPRQQNLSVKRHYAYTKEHYVTTPEFSNQYSRNKTSRIVMEWPGHHLDGIGTIEFFVCVLGKSSITRPPGIEQGVLWIDEAVRPEAIHILVFVSALSVSWEAIQNVPNIPQIIWRGELIDGRIVVLFGQKVLYNDTLWTEIGNLILEQPSVDKSKFPLPGTIILKGTSKGGALQFIELGIRELQEIVD